MAVPVADDGVGGVPVAGRAAWRHSASEAALLRQASPWFEMPRAGLRHLMMEPVMVAVVRAASLVNERDVGHLS